MAFEIQHKDDIQNRMKEQYKKEAGQTVIEGGLARNAINANSLEFENTYLEMNMMIEAVFIDTSWGTYLTMKCSEHGVDRKPATYAIGEVTFTGEKNRVIPAGTIVAVPGGNTYTTNEEANTGDEGEATVAITCTQTGAGGNVAAEMITYIPIAVSGIKEVTNAEETHEGYDEESDDELKQRFGIFIRTPATSSNKYHYYNWAMEITGVGDCRVIPRWAGRGTVKVMIVDSNGNKASDDLIQAVFDHIEENRAIGADVTVISPDVVEVTLAVSVLGTLNTELLINEITAHILKKGLDLRYLSEEQVVGMIMSQSSVEDCDNLTLNGQKKIYIGAEEIIRIKEVVLNEYIP